ncbi:hypothetical protein ACFFWD_40045 [Bradyrhizobium erythrophlei]|uniref:hypothetical protein n=1 Tax=Bradyrhizobium erythrophlei TaxID=1437360 RepID=UPI0035EB4B8C
MSNMTLRPYRESQSLQERLSDEHHRRCSQSDVNHDITKMARRDATASRAADRRGRDLAVKAMDEVSDNSASRVDRADRKRR